MLRHGGVGLSFSSYEAGMVTVAWYEVPAGARLARKAKPLPVLVAAGKLRFSAAGRGTLAIKLTPAGKVLLKHAKHVTLTAWGAFEPIGAAPVIVTRAFAIRR